MPFMTVERDEQDSPPEPNHAESYDTDIRFAIPGYETLHESAAAVLEVELEGHASPTSSASAPAPAKRSCGLPWPTPTGRLPASIRPPRCLRSPSAKSPPPTSPTGSPSSPDRSPISRTTRF